jgi:hypothetical protein
LHAKNALNKFGGFAQDDGVFVYPWLCGLSTGSAQVQLLYHRQTGSFDRWNSFSEATHSEAVHLKRAAEVFPEVTALRLPTSEFPSPTGPPHIKVILDSLCAQPALREDWLSVLAVGTESIRGNSSGSGAC